MKLGFSEQQAKAALEMHHHDVDLAASFLLSLSPASLAAMQPSNSRRHDIENEEEEEEDEEEEEEDDEEDCKMVLCVRQDLGMGVGKMCSQCAHAAVMLCDTTTNSDSEFEKWRSRWHHRGAAKIVLQVRSEEELRSIAASGRQAGLPTAVVADAGRTQVASGSETVVGIGPAPRSLIDTVTGKLRLL